MKSLLAPTEIEGDVRTRNDAETNGELWSFAGEAEAALKRANNDKALALKQIEHGGDAPAKCGFFRHLAKRC